MFVVFVVFAVQYVVTVDKKNLILTETVTLIRNV